jgi:hypothetical protein
MRFGTTPHFYFKSILFTEILFSKVEKREGSVNLTTQRFIDSGAPKKAR